MSNIERLINQTVIVMALIQLGFCLFLALLAVLWISSARHEHSYIDIEGSLPFLYAKALVTHFITLAYMVPMSMIVGMEVVKMGFALVIKWDALLYSSKENQFARVSNMSLIEDLGQVKFLFSDKTGTLTKNEMRFSSAQIGSLVYEAEGMQDLGEEAEKVDLFLKTLALCHDCSVSQTVDKEKLAFQVILINIFTNREHLLTKFAFCSTLRTTNTYLLVILKMNISQNQTKNG